MAPIQDSRSYLVKMRICNLGCIGPEGVEVSLDEIVCLVGANNSGKSTVLRAYEAAATSSPLLPDEVSTKGAGQPASVELWVHIPAGAENIDAKWKESKDEMLLVRSKWTWPVEGGKPVRTTWDPGASEYAEDGKASGLDTVFSSRLPRPFRIGSLEDPAEEHRKLLELVLEPIKTRLSDLMKDEGSELKKMIKALQEEAERPVAGFQQDLKDIQAKVNSSYRRVFSTAEVRLSVSLGELAFDPGAALVKSSRVDVLESHGQTRWTQQGTGSQRALFWSMLEVRSELNRIAESRRQAERAAKENEKELKKLKDKLHTLKQPATIDKYKADIKVIEDRIAVPPPGGGAAPQSAPPAFLPGYMLLIDEPETALHPAAIRAAKDHLYSLAAEAGWQVMLSTHHPAFIDPVKDHTTIVRLHRPEAHTDPNVYRADSMRFFPDKPADEEKAKDTLKTLLAFDQSVCEMFFSNRVIVVEGDTEFAAFTVAMDADPQAFPIDGRPLLLRARGKWTIPLLVRMLAHFKVSSAVLHDVDAPRSSGGAKRSGAYTANDEISKAVKAARDAGVYMIHRHSLPNFETQHGMNLPMKDKPFAAWSTTRDDAAVLASVRKILDDLCAVPDASAGNHAEDGRHFEGKLKAWVTNNAQGDPAFVFDP